MKIKKLFFSLFAVLLLSSVTASTSCAAFAEWAACTVTMTGYDGDVSHNRIYVENCNAGGDGWVSLNPKGASSMLAAALTAMSSKDQKVAIKYNGLSDNQGVPIIISLMAKNEI